MNHYFRTLIVCKNEQQAQKVRRQSQSMDDLQVIDGSSINGVTFSAPAKLILVCEGVALDQDFYGQGTLRNILKYRQHVFAGQAELIEL